MYQMNRSDGWDLIIKLKRWVKSFYAKLLGKKHTQNKEYVLRALPKKRKTEKGPLGLLQCSHPRREGSATIKLEQVMGKRGWAFDSVHEWVCHSNMFERRCWFANHLAEFVWLSCRAFSFVFKIITDLWFICQLIIPTDRTLREFSH